MRLRAGPLPAHRGRPASLRRRPRPPTRLPPSRTRPERAAGFSALLLSGRLAVLPGRADRVEGVSESRHGLAHGAQKLILLLELGAQARCDPALVLVLGTRRGELLLDPPHRAIALGAVLADALEPSAQRAELLGLPIEEVERLVEARGRVVHVRLGRKIAFRHDLVGCAELVRGARLRPLRTKGGLFVFGGAARRPVVVLLHLAEPPFASSRRSYRPKGQRALAPVRSRPCRVAVAKPGRIPREAQLDPWESVILGLWPIPAPRRPMLERDVRPARRSRSKSTASATYGI